MNAKARTQPIPTSPILTALEAAQHLARRDWLTMPALPFGDTDQQDQLWNAIADVLGALHAAYNRRTPDLCKELERLIPDRAMALTLSDAAVTALTEAQTAAYLYGLARGLQLAIRRYLPYRGRVPGPLFQTRGQRGKNRNGALETRSVLRIVRELGQKVGLHVWCHSLRHTSITQAAELGQRAGLGLDKIRAHSRHRSIATLMLYVDEHDRQATQRTLGDLVANTLTS
jgi:hypothetical protein